MSYFKRLSSFKNEIIKDKNTFGIRGWDTGISNVDEILSYVKGFSTVVFSYAHHGKTQFIIDNCVFLARKYKVVSAMYLTEAGKRSQAVLDIMQTLVGKQIQEITDEEFMIALDFIDKYFLFADIDTKLVSIEEIYTEVEALIKSGVKIDNVVIDHFHQLEQSPEQKFMDRADKTKYVMRKIGKESRRLDIHTFLTMHVRDTSPIQCPTSKLYYLPPPEKEDISGGQQASYLAYNMVSVWRPVMGEDKFGIINPSTGLPYAVNETIISVAKVKPKGSAKLGKRSIFFDVNKQRYYSVEGGVKIYAVDSLKKGKPNDSENEVLATSGEESALKPNLNFGLEGLEDAPF